MLPRGSDSWLSVGPTDYQVYACVSLDATGWGALESKTGPPTKRAVINVPDAVAAKLFDEASLGALTRDGGVCKVEGPVFDLSALTKMPYRGTAVRSGDSLLVYLSST
jgi:hypothetical protein